MIKHVLLGQPWKLHQYFYDDLGHVMCIRKVFKNGRVMADWPEAGDCPIKFNVDGTAFYAFNKSFLTHDRAPDNWFDIFTTMRGTTEPVYKDE